MTSRFLLRRRSCFTLLEILITFIIVAAVGAVVVFNFNEALKQQRFRSEVAMVVDQLRLAQDIMLILDADVHMQFSSLTKDKGIVYGIDSDYAFPKGWDKEFKRKHPPLTAIHSVTFVDETLAQDTQGVIDVKFLSGGSVMSKGILRLSSSYDENDTQAMIQYVCLPGYPSPLTSSGNHPGESCGHDAAFDEQMTALTRDEITAHTSPQNNPRKGD